MPETKPYNLQSPEQIAKDYNGNKQKIAEAMQLGVLDPTAGTLAGMFIDRMRAAAQMEAAPQQTVAQQVFAPPAQPAMPAGLGATPEAAAMMPTAPTNPTVPMPPPGGQEMAPQAPMMPGMAGGGLAGLYVPDNMFDEPTNGGFDDGYAGGGIVAFASGTGPYGVQDDTSNLLGISPDLIQRLMGTAPAPADIGPTDEYGRPLTFQGSQAFLSDLLPTYNDKYEKEAEAEYLKTRSPEEMKKARKEDMWMALGQIGARMATTPGSLLQAASTGIQEALPGIANQKAARKLEQKQALDALVGIEGQRYNRKGDRIKSALEFQGQAITADQAKKQRDQALTIAREGNISAENVARINKSGMIGAADKAIEASRAEARKQAWEYAQKLAMADPDYTGALDARDTALADRIFAKHFANALQTYKVVGGVQDGIGTGNQYPIPGLTPAQIAELSKFVQNTK